MSEHRIAFRNEINEILNVFESATRTLKAALVLARIGTQM